MIKNKKILLKYNKIKICLCDIVGITKKWQSMLVEKQDYTQILAIDNMDNIVFVKQFKVGGGIVHELPAGHIEPDESPIDCVKRELLEETGYQANSPILLFNNLCSPGILSNRVFAYYCEGVKKNSKQKLEDDEEIEIVLIHKEDVFKHIKQKKLNIDLGTMAILSNYFLIKKNSITNE